jgi:hypothetical protein
VALEVREAIAVLRAQNILVLIVTGRTLTELETVAREPAFRRRNRDRKLRCHLFPNRGYSKHLGDAKYWSHRWRRADGRGIGLIAKF